MLENQFEFKKGNTLKFSYDSKRWDHIKSLALRRDGYQCQLSKRYGKVAQALVEAVSVADAQHCRDTGTDCRR